MIEDPDLHSTERTASGSRAARMPRRSTRWPRGLNGGRRAPRTGPARNDPATLSALGTLVSCSMNLPEDAMKTALIVCAALMLAGTAQAQNSFYAVRIGAVDAPAVAKFYESVFGMQQVLQRGQEIMLNFGTSEAAAKANTGPV